MVLLASVPVARPCVSPPPTLFDGSTELATPLLWHLSIQTSGISEGGLAICDTSASIFSHVIPRLNVFLEEFSSHGTTRPSEPYPPPRLETPCRILHYVSKIASPCSRFTHSSCPAI